MDQKIGRRRGQKSVYGRSVGSIDRSRSKDYRRSREIHFKSQHQRRSDSDNSTESFERTVYYHNHSDGTVFKISIHTHSS